MEPFVIITVQPLMIDVNEKQYAVSFPVSRYSDLAERLGRSMNTPLDWWSITPDEIRDVLAVGLSKAHPEEAEDVARKVAEILSVDVEGCSLLRQAFLSLTFPRAKAKAEEAVRSFLEMRGSKTPEEINSANSANSPRTTRQKGRR